jgi:hypothetical protein
MVRFFDRKKEKEKESVFFERWPCFLCLILLSYVAQYDKFLFPLPPVFLQFARKPSLG